MQLAGLVTALALMVVAPVAQSDWAADGLASEADTDVAAAAEAPGAAGPGAARPGAEEADAAEPDAEAARDRTPAPAASATPDHPSVPATLAPPSGAAGAAEPAAPPTDPVDAAAEALGLPELLANAAEADTLPADLEPSLANASDALPRVYDDDCVSAREDDRPADCTYGEQEAPERTVVLFGDSHAAHWFPPLYDVAVDRGWQLIPLAKGSCPSLDVPVLHGSEPYTACTRWQEHSFARIAELQPDLVVLSNVRDYVPTVDAPDAARIAFQTDGLINTIRRLRDLVPDVELAVIGSTPHPDSDVATCLADEPDAPAACAGTPAKRLDDELVERQRYIAAVTDTTFVDPSAWMCNADVCPSVIDRYLVHNVGSHLAPSFTRWLRPVFEAALLPEPETTAWVAPAGLLRAH